VTSSERFCEVHVAGFGVHTGLGFGHTCLLDEIAAGKLAARKDFFNHPEEAFLLGFNPQVVPLAGRQASNKEPYQQVRPADMSKMISKVIIDALDRASIDAATLKHKRVCVFCGGQGMQPEGARFLFHIHKNDKEDIKSKKGIRSLNYENHNQDEVMHLLRDELGLTEKPISIFSASNSGFSAAWLGYCAVKSNHCDLAIAVSFQHISLFDLIFMNGFGALSSNKTGPFSINSKGAILGDAVCAMILESPAHLLNRKGTPYMAVDSMVMRQSAGSPVSRGAVFAPDFRLIGHTIEAAIASCPNLDGANDIACVFPHGNGVPSSDHAETMVLQKIWGKWDTPVVSYKAQTGYLMSSTALVDLALMSGFLSSGSLPAFISETEVDKGLGINLHANTKACTLSSKVGLKIGLGADGSIGAVIMRSLYKSRTTLSFNTSTAIPLISEKKYLGIYGLSIIEPATQNAYNFVPKWYKAWEAKMYAEACKYCQKDNWSITHFGGHTQNTSATREIAFALERSSRDAMQEGRTLMGGARINKERLALLYFDAWGQASYLEQGGSWKDNFSIDVIPWKVLKELQVGAFSCKIRSGRTAFEQAMQLASLLLSADLVDAVLVGGLFRFHPLLGFSEAITMVKTEQYWLEGKGINTTPVVERAGFMLVGNAPSEEQQKSGAIRIGLLPATRLYAGKAFSGLKLRFEDAAKTASILIGGVSPSLALSNLENKAILTSNPQAGYINTCSLYGDSGGINPLLAISHYRNLRRRYNSKDSIPSALFCMESIYGDAYTFLLE